jgi:hypothetical protein
LEAVGVGERYDLLSAQYRLNMVGIPLTSNATSLVALHDLTNFKCLGK